MTRFEVWAPAARSVEVEAAGRTVQMTASDDGWWRADLPDAGETADYGFVLDGEQPALPDPRSRWQPHGVHGPSRTYDHRAFAWTDQTWRGRQLAGSVLYELHIGTFTEEGTLDAAVGRLGHLVDLGVDMVELMPVAAFPGRSGWGYDGVHPYAVHDAYGGPDALKRFVDAAHGAGLAVCLDVVYNHLGPSGNYLPRFGPYFSGKHETPWGQGVNLDDDGAAEVRRWIIDNALMWLRDYHVDALRLDAVHALVDDSEVHLLAQMAREVDALATHVRRPLSLVAESDVNQPSTVLPVAAGGLGMTGQWSDDLHHALHALLTGEAQGYYGDFAADPYAAVEATMTGAFFHAGTHSSFRGEDWGAPVDRERVAGWHFLGYLQTHDQVGNRAVGERIAHLTAPGPALVGAALYLLSPFTPMLFMGEEWGASTPWQYFTSHEEPELAEAVREGRRREFGSHGWAAEDVPDPQASATVEASTLRWDELGKPDHAAVLAFYRALLRLRRAEPDLSDPRLDSVAVAHDAASQWLVVTRGAFRIVANLAQGEQQVSLEADGLEVVLSSSPQGTALAGSAVTCPGQTVAVVRVAG